MRIPERVKSYLFGATLFLGVLFLSLLLFYAFLGLNWLPGGVATWGTALLATISAGWLISSLVTLLLLIYIDVKYGMPRWAVEWFYRHHIPLFTVLTGISLILYAVGANDLLTDVAPALKKISASWRISAIILGSVALLFLSPHGLLWAIRIKLFWRHDNSLLQSLDRFFASHHSRRRRSSEWFHVIHLAAGVALADDSKTVLWVNPAGYMNLHAAAALLANRYHYSCLKAPDSVWNVLISHGGSRYAKILLSRELELSKRYVFCDNLETAKQLNAIRNFLADESNGKIEQFRQAASGGIKVFGVKKTSLSFGAVHDFSIFSVSTGWIIIEMHPADEEWVAARFSELDQITNRVQFEKRLAKIAFRAVIRFTRSDADKARPYDDAINFEITRLENESQKLQILPSDLLS